MHWLGLITRNKVGVETVSSNMAQIRRESACSCVPDMCTLAQIASHIFFNQVADPCFKVFNLP